MSDFKNYVHKTTRELIEAKFNRISALRNDGTTVIYGWWAVRKPISKDLGYPARYQFFRELMEAQDFSKNYIEINNDK